MLFGFSGRFTSTVGLVVVVVVVDVVVDVGVGLLALSTDSDGRFGVESGAELKLPSAGGSSNSLRKPHKEQLRLRY